MQEQVYEVESLIEKNHWWFIVRRNLFKAYIDCLNINKRDRILDVGSSCGTNLRLLKELGFKNYHGFDLNKSSKTFCEEKKLGKVMIGDISNSNLEDNYYHLVLATDIVEHVDNDSLAIKEIARILKSGGHLIITVPTFMCLWGLQDRVSMHKRRYLLWQIKEKIESANLKIIESYYFNFLLFLPIYIARKIIDLFKIELPSENSVNSGFVNQILKMIFNIDVFIARKVKKIPFGVSAFILAKKQ